MALFSALLAAVRRTKDKQLAQHLHPLTIGWATQVLGLPVSVLVQISFGHWLNPMSLGWHFWLSLVIVCSGFYPLNSLLYNKALRTGELSSVLPLQSLWSVFSIIPAVVFLGQIPSPVSLIGIIITVIGIYVLGLKGTGLHHPLQPFREDAASRYMILSVMLVTAAGVLDRIAIDASNALFYSLMSTIGAVTTMTITARMNNIKLFRPARAQLRSLTSSASLQSGSYTTYLVAMGAGPIAYVSAIRSSNVIIGSLLGVYVLHEPFTWQKRLSLACVIIGLSLLAAGS